MRTSAAHYRPMPRTYLTVPFSQKDAAKSLGAKWDATVSRWYVPETIDLAPFSGWLSASLSGGTVVTQKPNSASVAVPATAGASLSIAKTGVPLSRLLSGVASVVAAAYRAGVWTTVEVTEVRARGGHVYLDLSERDTSGTLIAKTTGTIWADTACWRAHCPQRPERSRAVRLLRRWGCPSAR